MNQDLHNAIQAVIRDAAQCSLDAHGFLQHMDAQHMAVLIKEYDKECRKHFKPRVRAQGKQSAPNASTPF